MLLLKVVLTKKRVKNQKCPETKLPVKAVSKIHTFNLKKRKKVFVSSFNSELAFTCSKSTMETLEKGVEYVQS